MWAGILQFRQAKAEIVSASKVAYRFLVGVASSNGPAHDSPGNSNRGSPRIQATWFKNLITSGAKPSSSTEVDNQEEVHLRQQHEQVSDLPPRQNSQQLSDLSPRQNSQQWESDIPALENSRHDV